MKLKSESIERKDPEMGTNSNMQHEEDSLENTAVAFTNWSTADDSFKISAEEIDPISKEQEEVVKMEVFESHSEETMLASKEKLTVKQQDFEVFLIEKSVYQNACSESEDCILTPTSESNSSESQECKIPAEESILASKEEQDIKLHESDVCLADVLKPPYSSEGLLTRQLGFNKSHQHEGSLKENLSAVEVQNGVLNIEDSKSHRENVHYSSDSSDYESDSSSWDDFYDKLHKNVVPSQLPTLKTKGELLIEDLPPVEDLHLNVDATELERIGTVLHSVVSEDRNEYLVVVASDGNSNPIDEDSVLFLSSDKPLGKIHDVFGSVSKPQYTIRFNKAEDIYSKGVVKGQDVYYLPENNELTHYVLVDALRQQKGSDASWKDNNEPPDDQIDYSDDEQEQLAKQKRRAKNRRNGQNSNEKEETVPNKMRRRHVTYNQERAFPARPSRNKFQSPTPNGSRSSPRSYSSSQSFNHTPPPSNFFGSQGNATLSQHFRLNSPNDRTSSRPFLQSNLPAPQAFGPSSQSRVPTPQLFGTFPQNNVPLYQPYTVPATSNTLASSNFSSSFATGTLQNSSFLMAAPQNNVPLQQQFLLQSQQPITSFLSRPPPNYNFNQNTRTFLHQNQSFTPPMFGAPPTIRPTLQNISNQSSATQTIFPFRANCPPTSLSGHLNVSQPRNISSVNSNGIQGQSGNVVQSNATSSFIFPQFSLTNTQHNNVYNQITQPVFVPNQPSPTPPFVPCQTPPPSIINQGLPVLSSPHPLVLPSQTPPPTFHPFAYTLPVTRSPMPPQNYPYN